MDSLSATCSARLGSNRTPLSAYGWVKVAGSASICLKEALHFLWTGGVALFCSTIVEVAGR